ncbi:MAG: hypothetical protein R3C15_24045 [Thermoleophilia bacterium]
MRLVGLDDETDAYTASVCDRVDARPQGWTIDFDELEVFARRFHQVIDGILVACTEEATLPVRADDDPTLVAKADMLLAAIDSSSWLVSAPEAVLARVEQRFRVVREVPLGDLPDLSLRHGRDY